MDISSISTEALRQELRFRQARQANAVSKRRSSPHPTYAGFVETDSDDDSLFVPEQRSKFTDDNPYQSRQQSAKRKSNLSQHATGRKRRCSRSLFGLSAVTKHERTTNVKDRPELNATRILTAAQQEEEDRQLAERLQAEEDFFFTDTQMLSSRFAVRTSPENGNRPAAVLCGSKDDPIDLSSTPRSARHSLVEVRAGKRTFKPNLYQDQTHDAAIARQLQKEETQAREERLHQAASRTLDCAVCADITPVIELPSLSSCSHQAEVCRGCYVGWIGTQLEANGWLEVKCPGTACKISLTYEEIKVFASKEVFERYDAFKARSALSSDPNFRWCRAEGCVSGQIHDAEEVGNEFVCVECHARFCTVHEGANHDNETCEEFEYHTSGQKERDERKKEEEATEEAVGKLTKKCPKITCGSPIQKNGGCNHITCWKCQHDFCYVCLGRNWKRCGHLHLPT